MKIVLAFLMCMAFSATQCFAISGGPVYPGAVTVTGTYAGVLTPVPIVFAPGPPPVTMTDNSMVLFTLVIPAAPMTGLGTGTLLVFRNGIAYSGVLNASADPDTARLTGNLNATASASTYRANGRFLSSHIVANTNTSSTASTRIRGRARLTYTDTVGDPNGDSGGPIIYRIRGFKQA